MAMDGVSDLQAYQWIAELLAFGIATFCGVCFMIGMIAGPEKVKPVGSNLKTNIDDQDLFAVATGDEEYLAAHCTLGTKKATARRTVKSQDSEVKRLKLEIQKLKRANKQEKSQPKEYNGTGWDAVDIAGNSGNAWNPPEYYEMYAPELIKTKKSKTKKSKSKKSNSKKPKSKKPKTQKVEQNSELIQECIAALVSLGEKKSVAKSTTNNYFTNNPNTKSVEEFIAGVYVK